MPVMEFRTTDAASPMTPLGQKRLVVGLSAAAVILAALAAWGWARATMSELHAVLVDGWSEMLQEGRDAALESTNVTEVAKTLRWMGHLHRPPETPASPIERRHYNMMERIRLGCQRDIVFHLRQLTGDQLGDDPKLWIEKYAKPER